MPISPTVYIEAHRARFRAVWRDAAGRKQREPFATRADAELFQSLCKLNPLEQVLAMVRGQRDPSALTWPPAGHRSVRRRACQETSSSAATKAAAGVIPQLQ